MPKTEKQSNLWIVLIVVGILSAIIAALIAVEFVKRKNRRAVEDFRHEDYVLAIEYAIVLGALSYILVYAIGFWLWAVIYIVALLASWLLARNIKTSKARQAKIRSQKKYSWRVAILCVSSLSVLIPIPALISASAFKLATKKGVRDLTTGQFALAALLSFFIGVFTLILSIFYMSVYPFLASVAIAIIFYAIARGKK